MLTSLYKWLKEKDEEIAAGLALGLALGLVWGLAAGLAWGLAVGLAVGLAAGLAAGLAVGLAAGLVAGFGSGLANIITTYPQSLPIWSCILIIIGIVELLFFLDKSKPKKKENKLWFTTKRKAEALFGTLLILVNLNNIRYLVVTYNVNFKQNLPYIIKWIGYIGIGVICLAVIVVVVYGYIYLNSFKYNKR